jgi:hypothetical protein
VVSVLLCISRRQHYYATRLIVCVHPLQCPTCKTVFKSLWNVDTCRKVGVSGSSGNVNASDQASGMNNMNNVTTNTNSHNTTVVNITCTPEQKRCAATIHGNIEAVVVGLRDPARFQLAMSRVLCIKNYARPHTLVTSNAIAIYLEYKLKVRRCYTTTKKMSWRSSWYPTDYDQ